MKSNQKWTDPALTGLIDADGRVITGRGIDIGGDIASGEGMCRIIGGNEIMADGSAVITDPGKDGLHK